MTYKGRPNRTMCESLVTCSRSQLPSKDTFVANISNPRSVNGCTNFKTPLLILAEGSSRDVNCDIFPVVDKKSENRGKSITLRSTCLKTLKSDQLPRSLTFVKEWASSKAIMITGVPLWPAFNFFFKKSVSILQDSRGTFPEFELGEA